MVTPALAGLRFSRGPGAALLLAAHQAQDGAPRVVVLPTSGIVDQVMAGYLREGIATAPADGDAAVVIELDTPGGDLKRPTRSCRRSWPRRCR